MRPVDGLFDVVVTTNAGFPLDQNLYQAVKGMSAAATVVVPGGLIICAAECADGFPDHGSFRAELAAAPTRKRLLASIARPDRTVPDQWQVQVLARVLRRARVGVHASGLTDAGPAQRAPVRGAGHRRRGRRRAGRGRARRAGVRAARGAADDPVRERGRGREPGVTGGRAGPGRRAARIRRSRHSRSVSPPSTWTGRGGRDCRR